MLIYLPSFPENDIEEEANKGKDQSNDGQWVTCSNNPDVKCDNHFNWSTIHWSNTCTGPATILHIQGKRGHKLINK